jgi:hypothetical protein
MHLAHGHAFTTARGTWSAGIVQQDANMTPCCMQQWHMYLSTWEGVNNNSYLPRLSFFTRHFYWLLTSSWEELQYSFTRVPSWSSLMLYLRLVVHQYFNSMKNVRSIFNSNYKLIWVTVGTSLTSDVNDIWSMSSAKVLVTPNDRLEN